MSSSDARRRALLACAGGAWLLTGCGFKLRELPTLTFRRIALVGFPPRSPLAAELRRNLERQVTVTEDVASAELVLQALSESRERSIVAQTAAAQVRVLQLRLRFEFRVQTPAGRELVPLTQLALARDMTYNETYALAKEQEQDELFREMQADIAEQVIRRLATVRLPG